MALAPTLRVGDLPRPSPFIGVFVSFRLSETPIDTTRIYYSHDNLWSIRYLLGGGKHNEAFNDAPEYRKNPANGRQLERVVGET